MKQVLASPLTAEDFQPYGCYQDLYNIEHLRRSPPGESGFYPDLVSMNLAGTTQPTASIAKVKRRPGVVDMLEYHRYTAEGLLPLDGDCIIFVGRAGRMFDLDEIRAFVAPKGCFVKLNPGTVHGTQFPIDAEWVRVLVILPEHTYDNDIVKKVLAEDEKFEVGPLDC